MSTLADKLLGDPKPFDPNDKLCPHCGKGRDCAPYNCYKCGYPWRTADEIKAEKA